MLALQQQQDYHTNWMHITGLKRLQSIVAMNHKKIINMLMSERMPKVTINGSILSLTCRFKIDYHITSCNTKIY